MSMDGGSGWRQLDVDPVVALVRSEWDPQPPKPPSRGEQLAERVVAPAWADRGACNGVGPDLWFEQEDGNNAEAKAICQSCPVRSECLEYGLHEQWGIWGGYGPRQRQRIAARRRREAA